MTTAKKAAAEKPAAEDTKPDEGSGNPDLDTALARVAELEAQLAEATSTAGKPATTGGEVAPVVAPTPLDPPADLPDGFVFNTLTGQSWCGQCIQHDLAPSATGWTCEHGSMAFQPRIFHAPTA